DGRLAKAGGASWGRLCPAPSSTTRNSTEISPPGPAGYWYWTRAAFSTLSFEPASTSPSFAFIGGEGRDKDQAGDVRGAGRGGGGGPCRRRSARPAAPGRGSGGAGWRRRPNRRPRRAADWPERCGVALPLQPFDDAVPAGRVGEGAVHEHDRRLDAGLLGRLG